ncbi:Response regulator protein TodT [invertebrate metagenome]|uniref:Response regulator protein TodT n=1 Tax=invertebrate metagenome TaxID=1711999 RepID=A0A2H9TC17_9ZZZZ
MNHTYDTAVYLFEQDSGISGTIAQLCEEKSIGLHRYHSEEELVLAIQEQKPFCIILASDVPKTNTLMLLEKLKKIPVIILGKHSDVSSAVATIKAGAIDYIEKPVVYGRLAEHFNQLLKQLAPA